MTESKFQFCRVDAPMNVWSNLTEFMKDELVPNRCISNVTISLDGAEKLDQPIPFLRINDQKVPRYYMAVEVGTKPHADWNKFRSTVRKYRMYWQFPSIVVYRDGIQQGAPMTSFGTFADCYDNHFRQLPPELKSSPFVVRTAYPEPAPVTK